MGLGTLRAFNCVGMIQKATEQREHEVFSVPPRVSSFRIGYQPSFFSLSSEKHVNEVSHFWDLPELPDNIAPTFMCSSVALLKPHGRDFSRDDADDLGSPPTSER